MFVCRSADVMVIVLVLVARRAALTGIDLSAPNEALAVMVLVLVAIIAISAVMVLVLV